MTISAMALLLCGCGGGSDGGKSTGGSSVATSSSTVDDEQDSDDSSNVLVTPTEADDPTGGDDDPPATSTPDAAPSAHRIVPASSIDVVSLGMGRSMVEQLLGNPRRVREADGELGSTTVLEYGPRTVYIAPEDGTVVRIDTEDPKDATTGGTAIGSRIGEVRIEFPQADCTGDASPTDICRVMGDDGALTDFFITGGRVSRVVVGYLRD